MVGLLAAAAVAPAAAPWAGHSVARSTGAWSCPSPPRPAALSEPYLRPQPVIARSVDAVHLPGSFSSEEGAVVAPAGQPRGHLSPRGGENSLKWKAWRDEKLLRALRLTRYDPIHDDLDAQVGYLFSPLLRRSDVLLSRLATQHTQSLTNTRASPPLMFSWGQTDAGGACGRHGAARHDHARDGPGSARPGRFLGHVAVVGPSPTQRRPRGAAKALLGRAVAAHDHGRRARARARAREGVGRRRGPLCAPAGRLVAGAPGEGRFRTQARVQVTGSRARTKRATTAGTESAGPGANRRMRRAAHSEYVVFLCVISLLFTVDEQN